MCLYSPASIAPRILSAAAKRVFSMVMVHLPLASLALFSGRAVSPLFLRYRKPHVEVDFS